MSRVWARVLGNGERSMEASERRMEGWEKREGALARRE